MEGHTFDYKIFNIVEEKRAGAEMGSFALSDLIIMEGRTDQQTDKSPLYVRNLKQNKYYIIAEDWWTGMQPPPTFFKLFNKSIMGQWTAWPTNGQSFLDLRDHDQKKAKKLRCWIFRCDKAPV